MAHQAGRLEKRLEKAKKKRLGSWGAPRSCPGMWINVQEDRGAHQGDVSVAGVQDFEHHVQLPAVVVGLAGEVLGLVVGPGGAADVEDAVVDVGAGALPQVGSLRAKGEGK